MTWHEHNNLCWGVGADGKPKVVGLTDANGNCARGVQAGGQNPMVHVWVVARPCGVFSALEGVGEGSSAVPQDQRTDTCAAAEAAHTHHRTVDARPPSHSDAAVRPDQADRSQRRRGRHARAAGARRRTSSPSRRPPAAVGRLPHRRGRGLPQHRRRPDRLRALHQLGLRSTTTTCSTRTTRRASSTRRSPTARRSSVGDVHAARHGARSTDVPDIGGALTQWHIHDNLCFTDDPWRRRSPGSPAPTARAARPASSQPAPMIHVWITPNKCGPFAALEGVGAGQVLPGETTQLRPRPRHRPPACSAELSGSAATSSPPTGHLPVTGATGTDHSESSTSAVCSPSVGTGRAGGARPSKSSGPLTAR